tara:strand:+ start:1335 stop:1493 length:159 start_codon:yes stop_codon:yes gene_type:complete
MLRIEEIADELQVSIDTVRRWIKTRKLRAFKLGYVIRVRQRDLDEFLKQRTA